MRSAARRNRRCRRVGGAPEAFAPALRMQNGSLPKSEKSLVLSSIQAYMAFPVVAKQMSRLFWPRGGAARQDVLVAADVDASSKEECDYAAWVARRKAKKGGENKRNGGGDPGKKAKIMLREMIRA